MAKIKYYLSKNFELYW